jgi:hypothetical protein
MIITHIVPYLNQTAKREEIQTASLPFLLVNKTKALCDFFWPYGQFSTKQISHNRINRRATLPYHTIPADIL